MRKLVSGRPGPVAFEAPEQFGEPPLGRANPRRGLALGAPRPLPDPLLAIEGAPGVGGEVAEPCRKPGRLLA
ncbi:MAG: hypothetical protein EDQ89_00135 [Acidobacteria bacterium]|nr:MAG: hypothetical protein EDQ89_00135 [Acidobacteriota bacterium]